MVWMREMIRDAGDAIASAGLDLVPCHGSGESSNVMIGPSARIALVDFDCAGLADPFYDIGILLTEACQFEPEMRAGLEIAFGRQDEAMLNRCRLYGAADDLYWGLRGLVMAATSPRRDIEFLKFGEWRLLRCRMFLHETRFEERLRRL
jgi:thiamine kinase-like enzyme